MEWTFKMRNYFSFFSWAKFKHFVRPSGSMRKGDRHSHACWWKHKLVQAFLLGNFATSLSKWRVGQLLSRCTFLFQQCWAEPWTATLGPQGHFYSATCQDSSPLLSSAGDLPQTDQPAALCLLHPPSVSFHCFGDETALENSANCYLLKSH